MMEYVQLGRINVNVSKIGIGGEWLNGVSESETQKIIKTAYESGINFLDVFMPQPKTRDNIGNAIKGIRKNLIIQGHLCTAYKNGQYVRTRNLDKTKFYFQDLLTRLQTDYIDIGMLHYIDSEKDYQSVFETDILSYALELKARGVIKHIGLSSHNPSIALKAIETGLIDVLMFSINPAYDLEKTDTPYDKLKVFDAINENELIVEKLRQKLYRTCDSKNIAVTVMKCLASGKLLNSETSPFKVDMTVAQCLSYCFDRPGVKSVFLGFNKVDEVKEAVKYFDLEDDEKDYSFIYNNNGAIEITGSCMYCNHCQPCPANLDIAAITKFLDLSLITDNKSETAKQHYYSLEHHAGECIECGSCEANCPFDVKVIENMRQAKIFFEK